MAGAAVGRLPVASLSGGRCGVLSNACPPFLVRHSGGVSCGGLGCRGGDANAAVGRHCAALRVVTAWACGKHPQRG